MQHQPTVAEIAGMILSAPVWAKLALAVRDPRAQQRAADVIAARIADNMVKKVEADPRQLMLPIGG